MPEDIRLDKYPPEIATTDEVLRGMETGKAISPADINELMIHLDFRVLGIENAPTREPLYSDIYFIGDAPTELSWVGHEGELAIWLGTEWIINTPLPGPQYYVSSQMRWVTMVAGGEWVDTTESFMRKEKSLSTWFVSTAFGDDVNGDGSIYRPFATVQHTIDTIAAGPGYGEIMMDDTVDEDIEFDIGTMWLTFAGFGSGIPYLRITLTGTGSGPFSQVFFKNVSIPVLDAGDVELFISLDTGTALFDIPLNADNVTFLLDGPTIYTGVISSLPATTYGHCHTEAGDMIFHSFIPMDLHSHLIKNITDPEDGQDAATKHYVDDRSAVSRVLYVTKGGDDGTGDGSIALPFLTISAAITAAVSGTTILIAPGAYDENVTLKAGVFLQSMVDDSYFDVTITGKVTYPSGAGNVVMSGIYGYNTVDHALELLGGDIQKLRCYNCKFETNSAGAHHAFRHANSNAASEVTFDNTVLQALNSSGGARGISTAVTSAGSIGCRNTTIRLNDNVDNVAVDLTGAVSFWQVMDEIRGRVQVAMAAAAKLSAVAQYTSAQPCLTTNSAGLTVVANVVLSTLASPAVSGAGAFAYAGVVYASAGSGFAATLNGGLGPVVGALPMESARNLIYNPAVSGLLATRVQTAIDELAAAPGAPPLVLSGVSDAEFTTTSITPVQAYRFSPTLEVTKYLVLLSGEITNAIVSESTQFRLEIDDTLEVYTGHRTPGVANLYSLIGASAYIYDCTVAGIHDFDIDINQFSSTGGRVAKIRRMRITLVKVEV